LRRTTHRLVFGGGSARALEDVDRLNRRLALRAFPHSTCPLLASHIASSTAAIGSNHVQGGLKSRSHLESYFATFGALDLLYFPFVIRGHVDLPDFLDSDHHRLGGGIVLEPDPVLPAVEQNNSKRASQVRTRAGVQALILILDNHAFFPPSRCRLDYRDSKKAHRPYRRHCGMGRRPRADRLLPIGGARFASTSHRLAYRHIDQLAAN
jgi:hypothetical protein